MAKKIVALLLSAMMAVSCLAACSSTSETDTSAEDTTAAEETEAGEEETEADSEETEESVEADVQQGDASVIDALIDSTSGTVALEVWASEEDQAFTQTLIDGFKEEYSDVDFDITLGAVSESTAKDTVLADVSAAADVFAFADDQLNELVAAGALQAVNASYTFDVASENNAGSVNAATMDGTLYAYPMTADNGYFLYYNSSVHSDVSSFDAMVADAQAAGTKIAMELGNGWYLYGFFKGAGLEATLADNGTDTVCTWNADGGVDVAQAILDLINTGVFVNSASDADTITGVQDGTYSAVINGTWNAQSFEEAWGDDYAASKLPTFTCAGEQVQMASFAGYKLVGVNAYSENVAWAMILAEYLTDEDAQIARFETRALGPSNIAAASSDAVQTNPAIAALAAQSAYGDLQRVGNSYWDPAASLGATLAQGSVDDIQALLDKTVDAIQTPAT